MADEPHETNRDRKLEGRDKARRHVASSRAYLHAMTQSKVERVKKAVERADRRRSGDVQTQDEE